MKYLFAKFFLLSNYGLYKKTYLILFTGFLCLSIGGCASIETLDDIYVEKAAPQPDIKGVYHKAAKGETLWKIADAYGVTIEQIVAVNSIPDAAKLEENRLIFVPGVERSVNIPVSGTITEHGFIWPLQGKVVSFFRGRNSDGTNKGIDIEVKNDFTVRAARSGKVVFADYLSGYGSTVILEHPEDYCTVYSFNSDFLVKFGANIAQGTEIGKIKKINDRAYLHFEIRRNSVEVNPLYYLP